MPLTVADFARLNPIVNEPEHREASPEIVDAVAAVEVASQRFEDADRAWRAAVARLAKAPRRRTGGTISSARTPEEHDVREASVVRDAAGEQLRLARVRYQTLARADTLRRAHDEYRANLAADEEQADARRERSFLRRVRGRTLTGR